MPHLAEGAPHDGARKNRGHHCCPLKYGRRKMLLRSTQRTPLHAIHDARVYVPCQNTSMNCKLKHVSDANVRFKL